MSVRRLHWGCGQITAPGWINSDRWAHPGVDLQADILEGLPLEDGSIDYAVSNHALQELDVYEQEVAFTELRRVLKDGGVLRLCLPDVDRAIDAYRSGDRDWFIVDEWETIGGNFVTQLIWHGYNKTPFVFEFAEELARRAGFGRVERSAFQETASGIREITELDSREDESFFLEAWK